MSTRNPLRTALAAYKQLVTRYEHILRREPWLLFQYAANMPDLTAPALRARAAAAGSEARRSWLEHLNKPPTMNPRIRSIPYRSNFCAYSTDGLRLISFAGGSFSAAQDEVGHLFVFDAATGREIASFAGSWSEVVDLPRGSKSQRRKRGKSHAVLRTPVPPQDVNISPSWSTSGRLDAPDGRRYLMISQQKLGFQVFASDSGRRVGYVPLLWLSSDIECCAYAPDGSHIAVATQSGIDIFDANAVEASDEAPKQGSIAACAYSSDGDQIAIGSPDGTLHLLDSTSGKLQRMLTGHAGPVTACAVSQDGSQIASATAGSIKIWDSYYEEFAKIDCPDVPVTVLAFSKAGYYVVAGFNDGTAVVYSYSGGEEAELTLDAPVTACAFSPRSDLLVTGAEDGSLRLWDGDSAFDEIALLQGHSDRITACTFDASGEVLLSCSRDGTLRVWDVEAKEQAGVRDCEQPLLECVMAKSGAIVFVSSNGSITTIEGEGDQLAATEAQVSGPIQLAKLSPTGKLAVTAADDATIRIWDAGTGNLICQIAAPASKIQACTFSDDERVLYVGADDRTLRGWDTTTGFELATIGGHRDIVNDCDFSPDGVWIASASQTEIKIWDTRTGSVLNNLYAGSPRCCAWSPNGLYIAMGENTESLYIWDIEDKEIVAMEQDLPGSVSDCCFSRDGNRLLCAAGSMIEWEWNGELTNPHEISAGASRCSYSPDGSRIASVSGRVVSIWDAPEGGLAKSMSGHRGDVLRCAWLPSGRHVVSAAADLTVRIWDVNSASEVAKFYLEDAPWSIAVHPTKPEIAVGGHMGGFTLLRFHE